MSADLKEMKGLWFSSILQPECSQVTWCSCIHKVLFGIQEVSRNGRNTSLIPFSSEL